MASTLFTARFHAKSSTLQQEVAAFVAQLERMQRAEGCPRLVYSTERSGDWLEVSVLAAGNDDGPQQQPAGAEMPALEDEEAARRLARALLVIRGP